MDEQTLIQLLGAEQRNIKLIERYFEDIEIIQEFIQTYGKQFLVRFCQVVQVKEYKMNEILIEQGNYVNYFLLLMQGEVQKIISRKDYELVQFGPIAETLFITCQPSKYMYIASQDSIICLIRKDEFLRVVKRNTITMSLVNELLQYPLYSEFSQKLLEQITLRSQIKQFVTWQIVYDINEEPNYFYIIKKGEFQIQYTYLNKFRPLVILAKGDFFGSAEIIKKCSREYRVVCVSADAELLCLQKLQFQIFMQYNPQFQEVLSRNQDNKSEEYKELVKHDIKTLSESKPFLRQKISVHLESQFVPIRKINQNQIKSLHQLYTERDFHLKQLLQTRWDRIQKDKTVTSKERNFQKNPRLKLFLEQLESIRSKSLQKFKQTSQTQQTLQTHRRKITDIPKKEDYIDVIHNSTQNLPHVSPPISSRYMKIIFKN